MFQTTELLLSTAQALLFQTIFWGKQIHVLGDMDRQEEQAEKKCTPPSLDISNIHVSIVPGADPGKVEGGVKDVRAQSACKNFAN